MVDKQLIKETRVITTVLTVSIFLISVGVVPVLTVFLKQIPGPTVPLSP